MPKLKGMDELKDKLQKLAGDRIRSATFSALRAGANNIRDEARRSAPNDPATPESISRNIVVRQGKKRFERQSGGLTVRVGVLGGAADRSSQGEIQGAGNGNPGGDTFYWRFLEFGTSRGISPQRFMRDALNKTAPRAIADFQAKMKERIDKEVQKLQ